MRDFRESGTILFLKAKNALLIPCKEWILTFCIELFIWKENLKPSGLKMVANRLRDISVLIRESKNKAKQFHNWLTISNVDLALNMSQEF